MEEKTDSNIEKIFNFKAECIYYDNTDDFLNSRFFFEKTDDQYQKDFLNFFNLKEFDDKIVNYKVKILFDQLILNEEWKTILILANNELNNFSQLFNESKDNSKDEEAINFEDLEVAMMILFSINFFHIFRKCILHYFKDKHNKNKYFEFLKLKIIS